MLSNVMVTIPNNNRRSKRVFWIILLVSFSEKIHRLVSQRIKMLLLASISVTFCNFINKIWEMRWLAFILWLLLGVIYFSIWSCSKESCCTATMNKTDSEPKGATQLVSKALPAIFISIRIVTVLVSGTHWEPMQILSKN